MTTPIIETPPPEIPPEKPGYLDEFLRELRELHDRMRESRGGKDVFVGDAWEEFANRFDNCELP